MIEISFNSAKILFERNIRVYSKMKCSIRDKWKFDNDRPGKYLGDATEFHWGITKKSLNKIPKLIKLFFLHDSTY